MAIFLGMRCWSSGFRVQQIGNEEKVAFKKVDIPIYPDRSECQRRINTAPQNTEGEIKEIELSPGEVCSNYYSNYHFDNNKKSKVSYPMPCPF